MTVSPNQRDRLPQLRTSLKLSFRHSRTFMVFSPQISGMLTFKLKTPTKSTLNTLLKPRTPVKRREDKEEEEAEAEEVEEEAEEAEVAEEPEEELLLNTVSYTHLTLPTKRIV